MQSIPLSQGHCALVDDDDFERVSQFKWTYIHVGRQTCYAVRTDYQSKPAKAIYLHRFVLNAQEGDIVDHHDHDGLNNQKHNLRIVTRQENSFNRVKSKRAKRTSQYKGVSAKGKKWRAIVCVDGQNIIVGTFDSEINAARAYDKAVRQIRGDLAYLNFPEVVL